MGLFESVRIMNRPVHCVRFWILCLLCVVASLSAASNVLAADSESTKRVLIISTGSRFSIGFPIVEQNAVDRLRELHRGQLEIYAESLDIIRFRSEKYQQVFHDYLRDKYANDAPDVIVLIYVGNLAVTENHLQQVFPTTPVVAVGLTEEAYPAAAFGAQATGVAQRFDPIGTIEEMLRLQPDLQRIVLIGGTAPVDRETMDRTRRAARIFSKRVEFLVWDNRSIDDILKAVTSLPPQTAVLFTRMFRDGAGRATISAAAARSIAKVSNTPVYVMADAMLGTGAVGGSAVDTGALGKRAGELANRILSGAEPTSLPLEIINKGVPIFDWRALQRWGINENRLPKNSIVRFRPESMWEDHKQIIIGIVSLIILEAALIYILLRERRRRKLAQQTLEERLRFEQLVAELSSTFINLPPNDIEAQLIEALGRVGNLLAFDIAALSVFTGPGLAGRVAYLWRAEGVPEISSCLTERDFPWVAQELYAGHDVSLRTLDGLPPEAQIDRATYEQYHVRSTYNVPMVAGGKVIGVLGLCTVWEERGMSRELLQSQRLLGEVFANALERKNAEETRRESENRFLIMADSAPVMIWMSGTNKLCEYFNKQWLKFTGRTLEQELGDGWTEGVHRDDLKRCLEIYGRSFDARQEFAMEYRLRRWDGNYGWVLDHGVPRFEAKGTFLGYIGSCIEITERKQAEEKFRLAVEASPSAIVMSNGEGKILLVNAQTEKLFGYSREELVGQPVETLVPDRFRSKHSGHRAGFLAAPQARRVGTGQDLYVRRKDGSEVMVELGLSPIQTPEGLLVLTSIVDVSARREAEEALEKERRFLRQVIDIDPNFIFAKDREGRFTLVNRAVADAYGTTPEGLLGKTDADFNPNRDEVEFFHRIDLEVIDKLQEHFIAEECLTDARGQLRWLQTVKRPIIEENGVAKQVLGASTDITSRKKAEAELRQQRDELAHLTRISTMGELAASLAHELNQPLTAILSNAQAAQRFLAANTADVSEVKEILRDIVEDNNRATEVLRKLRAMVKKDELKFAPLDLAALISDVVLLVHSDAILQNVSVSLELNPGLPKVRGDNVQLQQVMLNLLLNAFDAIKDCPLVERAVSVKAEPDDLEIVKVSVRDRGAGLASDQLEKVFQPFYTTKREGLGMGLSISRSIIEAHGGRLWAENNSDRGATFCFTVRVEKSVEGQVTRGA